MRKFTLFAVAGAFFALTAQSQNRVAEARIPVQVSEYVDAATRVVSATPILDSDTLLHDDFSTMGNWTFNNASATYGWEIGSNVSWAFNNFQSTSGAPFAMVQNGDNNNGFGPIGEHSMTLALPLNISTISDPLYLSFQQLTAKFFDQYFVEVSNNGSFWTVIGSNDHLMPRTSINTTPGTSNPEYVSLLIPSSITAGNDLHIRFRWKDIATADGGGGGVAYGWMVDDVVVQRAPDNDLSIDRTYFNGTNDTVTYILYSKMPEKQANSADFEFAAAISNNGAQSQSNVVLTVTESTTGYSGTSAPMTLASEAVDTALVTTPLTPTALTPSDNLNIEFSIAGSTADGISVNNTREFEVDITPFEYAYDDEEPQGNTWFGDNGYTMCVYYDVFAADTIAFVKAHFPRRVLNDGSVVGLKRGGLIGALVYDNELNQILNGSTEFHQVPDPSGNEQFINGWYSIPVNVAVDPNVNDGIYVCIKAHEDQIVFSYDLGTPDGYQFVDPDNLGTWYTPISSIPATKNIFPYIRAVMLDNTVCDNVDIAASGTTNIAYDATDSSSATLSVAISGAMSGTPPYSYNWGGGITTATRVVTSNGVYSLTVSDVNQCSGTFSFNVTEIQEPEVPEDDTIVMYDPEIGDTIYITPDGDTLLKDANGNFYFLGVNDFQIIEDVKVYPNPNNGQFSIEFKQSGSYEVVITNLLGESVFNERIVTPKGQVRNIDLQHVSKGVYTIKVSDGLSTTTKQLIVQ